ncbi:hypothetical protein O3M35_010948 [Rhynocoris fuscipes]|uniref:Dynein regulatory complex protein 10 n=1 Tax=Rhynocoris fuscipes TaxID=488301 RepID=A0AAW1D125_9HEMI
MWFSLKSDAQIRKKMERQLQERVPTPTDEHGQKLMKIADDERINTYYKVELNKIGQIIEQGYNKIKFALPLAYLFDEKYDNLEYLLGSAEVEVIKALIKNNYQLLNEDDNNPESQPLGNILEYNSPESFQDFINNYVSNYRGVDNTYEELDILIDHFYNNEKVKNFVEQKLIYRLPESARDFVIALQLFLKIIYERMELTPDYEFAKDYGFAKMYRGNFELMEGIDRVKAEIEPISHSKDDIMQKNTEEVDAIEKEIIELTHTIKKNMKRNKKIFEKRMDWDWKVHETNNHVNVEMLSKRKQQLDQLIKSHIEIESAERALKFKKESSLQFLIDKYDTNMAEKNKRFDDLTEQWKSLRYKVAEAEEKFEETDKIYQQLMDEKTEYETDVWNKKLYRIQCNIAARKIQRYFRLYLKLAGPVDMNPKLKKKKGKKGK